MDKSCLAQTKWNCKYHVIFSPKYRRQLKREIGKIIRVLCERKGVEIVEAEARQDHIPSFHRKRVEVLVSD